MEACIILEDGTIFEGDSFGWVGEKGGEVVFNTSLTGYQEILTDPSYKGQILVMTYPQIGNYGVNEVDMESEKCHLGGFIVKEYSSIYSNQRAKGSLSDFLKENQVIGISGIDTRTIVRKTRELGAMSGFVVCGEFSKDYLLEKVKKVPPMTGLNLADEVSTLKLYKWKDSKEGSNKKIVVIDCGVKFNILRNLSCEGEIIVVPSKCPAEEIMALKPSGVVISNGPGDPSVVFNVQKTVSSLLGKVPIMGICLGHQILALALGAETFKLKFGHRGANHPVKNLENDLVEITSQNHGFAVLKESLDKIDEKKFGLVKTTHINLNDGTVEGIECPSLRAFSVQYHPESSPGPHDSNYLFGKFFKMMEAFS